MGSHTKRDPLFLANPAYNSESLGSASEMLNNFAAILEPVHRKTALGTAQVVMVAGLAVNQALDHVEVKT
ncbi:hypothetical protein PS947_05423 [Pseudomonas fluorescens]|nr:hypothetical protein PS947_05423 [Pseudomonas fluorescens]